MKRIAVLLIASAAVLARTRESQAQTSLEACIAQTGNMSELRRASNLLTKQPDDSLAYQQQLVSECLHRASIEARRLAEDQAGAQNLPTSTRAESADQALPAGTDKEAVGAAFREAVAKLTPKEKLEALRIDQQSAELIKAAAHEEALQNLAGVTRDVICRNPIAVDLCADATAETHRAELSVAKAWKRLSDPSGPHAGFCILPLHKLATMAETQVLLERLLKQWSRPGFGGERLLVMREREGLAKLYRVEDYAIEGCRTASPVFGRELHALQERFKVE
jgi:hypothetical protein